VTSALSKPRVPVTPISQALICWTSRVRSAFESSAPRRSAGMPAAPASQPQSTDSTSGPTLAWADVKLKNKWWFQGLLTFVIPLAGLIFLFMKSYQKGRKGEAKRVSVWFKLFFVAAVFFVWASILARPQGDADYGSGDTNAIGSIADLLPRCDSADARALINDAITNNVANNIATLRLLDVTEVQEISATDGERRCNATLFLNSGSERVGYRMFPSSDRSMMLIEIVEPYANATLPPAPGPAPSEPSSNIDYGRVRERNLTADQVSIVEYVCAVPANQRVNQLSIAELSYDTFCLDGAR